MRAAHCLDIPLSFKASYCLSFLTLGRFVGTGASLPLTWGLLTDPSTLKHLYFLIVDDSGTGRRDLPWDQLGGRGHLKF
jgi:hypothetical protein